MNPQTADLIQTVTYLLPIAALVWKAATQNAEIKEIRKDLEYNIERFCQKHSRIEEKLEAERISTDSAISTILNSLQKIELSVERINTTLELNQQKK